MSMVQPLPVPDGRIPLSRQHDGPPPGPADEDGCTVRRPRLRAADPGLWVVIGILATATGWLIGNH